MKGHSVKAQRCLHISSAAIFPNIAESRNRDLVVKNGLKQDYFYLLLSSSLHNIESCKVGA
jgi:hypothetical protein